MQERRTYVPLRWISHSTTNYKVANARTFQALWEAGRVYLPDGKPWAQDLVQQLTRFPLGTLDDKVDVCSIFARLINKVWAQAAPKPKEEPQMVAKYGDGCFVNEKNELVLNLGDIAPMGNDQWL